MSYLSPDQLAEVIATLAANAHRFMPSDQRVIRDFRERHAAEDPFTTQDYRDLRDLYDQIA